MNRLPLFALSALLHAYVGLRLVPSLSAWPVAAGALAILVCVSALVIPLGMMLRRRRRRYDAALQWTSLIATGLFSSLLVLTFLRGLLLLAAGAIAWMWPDALS
ncbi:MAG: metallophosphoesterase, partial [Betaproteobacteria bacterium]